MNPFHLNKIRMILFIFISMAILVASGWSAMAASNWLQSDQDLFTNAATQGSLTPSTEQVTTRYVNINFALLDNATEGDAIGLNLYDDLYYTAILERKEIIQPEGYIWIGYLQGVEYSQVVLAVGGGQIAGNITSPLGQFQVRYAGNGVHAIYTIDQSTFPDELPPISIIAESEAESNISEVSDLCTSIDVMVVWTQAAETAAGGSTAMQNLINLAKTETNQSYINSNMTQRINLVHAEKVSYTESGDFSTDLTRLRNLSDGYIDNVPLLRNTYYADLVSMFIEGTQYCGIGYLMSTVSPSFESNAYTVVAQSCATGYYSFAHEMGHNEGALHEWYTDPGTTPYEYAHGFVNTVDRWRTIMSYNNQCSDSGFNCTRLQYWSNPDITYGGDPMGVPSGSYHPADNHLALNNTCTTVANFRDRPDPPGTFDKTSPANEATSVSTNPTLSWGSSSEAISYEYCYDTSNDNACSSWTNVGSNTSVGLSGLGSNTTYYWQVRANNGIGTTYAGGSSTAFWSFTTGNVPEAFAKTTPTNGATVISTTPTLIWGSSSGATSYEYCYDTSNDNACSGWTNNGTAISVGLSSLSAGTTYFWHVRAINSIGMTYANSSSTAFWSFTTGNVPDAFNKTAPTNGDTNILLNPTLSWGSSSGVTSYAYCIDTSNNSTCDASWVSTGTNTSVGLSSLSTGTTFYWHIRAENSFGTTYADGSATSFWSFTTENVPGAFAKTTPTNGAIGISTSPTLIWGSSNGATGYDYCYDTTNDNACSNWTSVGSNTSMGLSGLSLNTTYYWQVRANNGIGTTYADGSSTAFWSFTTENVPEAFAKTTPTNGAIGISTSPTLIWGSSNGATGYDYCYDTTNDNACSNWTSVGSNTSMGLSGLSLNTTYYWQVRANNGIGTTYANNSSTAFWSFKTATFLFTYLPSIVK